ncbi:hypothetical protein DWB77_03084 [Streptomyces hundungensis]|uniref:Uncharacterized protein n=1 Tax=Streptomyces hundungensis TaxID=1077946 RepID=A0A387HAR0_9ACTN|nr:hypothetical protein DWB77_03084 [Streptomyces hundungensis]
MTAVLPDLKTGRTLVSDELFDSIVHFTVTHFGQDRERAEQQTDQALAFAATGYTAERTPRTSRVPMRRLPTAGASTTSAVTSSNPYSLSIAAQVSGG